MSQEDKQDKQDTLDTPKPNTQMTSPLDAPPAHDTTEGLASKLSSTSISSDGPLPALDHSSTPSASSTTLSSLSSDGDEVESPEIGAVDTDGMDASDPVLKYRQGIYLYTRELYRQARAQSAKPSAKTDSVAPKLSGMERMAAKKALAQRMRD
ncbi:hypothetical protein P7C73_g2147, partial [Tremellales sp. Uapishka_1]